MMIIVELSTNHGGDLDIAKRMIEDAAKAGANMVKTQAYDVGKLNPADPQAEWLRNAHLTEADHVALKEFAAACGVRYFASAFDKKSANFVSNLCGVIKVASTVDVLSLDVCGRPAAVWKSHPWRVPAPQHTTGWSFVTVPMYPTPLEALVGVSLDRATGWSDHCVGLSGCYWALGHQNITHLEVHMTTDYAARQCPWDKTPEQIRQLRDWCDDLETIRSGVSRVFRDRWTA